MRVGAGKLLADRILVMFSCLLLAGLSFGALCASAAELGFTKSEGEMVFTIPYESVPEINALFVDSGTEVALALPAAGIQINVQKHLLDDEWITAFGIERSGDEWRWYLKKRDSALKVKSFLALERQTTVLKIVLLKPYRQWQPTADIDKNSALHKVAIPSSASEQGKLDRLNQLLKNPDSGGVTKSLAPGSAGDKESSPSLLVSAVRSFVVLIFLVLVIFGLSVLLKRYRKKGGRLLGPSLVKVLSVEVISGKHQVMLLELLGEVLVVGVCGERMTLLTTISDPDRVAELQQLHGGAKSPGGKRRFSSYLQGFLEKDTSPRKVNSDAVQQEENFSTAAVSGSANTSINNASESDELPDNYKNLVSQIKHRLQKNDRG